MENVKIILQIKDIYISRGGGDFNKHIIEYYFIYYKALRTKRLKRKIVKT